MIRFFHQFSLLAKMTILLSLVVVVVIFTLTYLINKASADSIERDITASISKAAEEIPEQLIDETKGSHVELQSNEEIADTLSELQTINLNITEISVFRLDPKKELVLAATTGKSTDIPIPPKALEAIERRRTVTNIEVSGNERYFDVWTPIEHKTKRPKPSPALILGCVSMRASLQQSDRISKQNLAFALQIFAPVTIILLSILLSVLFRFIIHRPVKTIQAAMAKAEAGNLEAEVPLASSDELGQIAASFNQMLRQIREVTAERIHFIEQINNFNVELKSKVASATAELTERNLQLRDLNVKLLKMQLDLVQMERMAVAGQMTATFAHEVGTPLNLISGHVQLLMESFKDDDFALKKLTLIESQIHRLSEIVRRLLDATRYPKVEILPTNLQQLLNDIGALIGPTLQTRRVVFSATMAPEVPSIIQADRKQLEQVLLNLVNNSLDAMPDGGKLSIEAAMEAGPKVAIRVSDSGSGIAPAHLEKLFQPMFTTKEMGTGTGLGLAICKAIIKEHGGEILVESTPNQGATFTLLLPCEEPIMQKS